MSEEYTFKDRRVPVEIYMTEEAYHNMTYIQRKLGLDRSTAVCWSLSMCSDWLTNPRAQFKVDEFIDNEFKPVSCVVYDKMLNLALARDDYEALDRISKKIGESKQRVLRYLIHEIDDMYCCGERCECCEIGGDK